MLVQALNEQNKKNDDRSEFILFQGSVMDGFTQENLVIHFYMLTQIAAFVMILSMYIRNMTGFINWILNKVNRSNWQIDKSLVYRHELLFQIAFFLAVYPFLLLIYLKYYGAF